MMPLTEPEIFVRVFHVLVIQGILIVIFWILAFLLLKLSRSRIKTVFACSYFLFGLG